MIGYILTDQDGTDIAVLVKKNKLDFNISLLMAVKEHFSYETVENKKPLPSELDGSFILESFEVTVDCETEDGEEEVRDLKLTVTSIY